MVGHGLRVGVRASGAEMTTHKKHAPRSATAERVSACANSIGQTIDLTQPNGVDAPAQALTTTLLHKDC